MKSQKKQKRAAKQTSLDLTSEKIPKLKPIVPEADNNLAQWLFIVDRRWKLCVKYDNSSMNSFVNTIKEHAGPLKTSLINKNSYQEVWTVIKRRVLNGRASIQNRFNISGPSFRLSLDTGKCLDLMEIFIMVSKIVVNLKLQQFIEPEDIKTMARSMLLFTDLSHFNNELSNKRSTRRGDDTSTTQLMGVMDHLAGDLDTSAITLGDTGSGGDKLFCSADIDMNNTQEHMIGGGPRDPIRDFITLARFVARQKRVYSDKIDAMTLEDLAREAKSEAFLQQVQVSSSNCSVYDVYKNKFKSSGKPGISLHNTWGDAGANKVVDTPQTTTGRKFS